MITQIIGRLVEKTPTQVVIDCNGVGYAVHISLHTFSQIGNDENIKLFTHLQVREDAHTLFGFHTPMERSVFLLLLSVSGIGASTAQNHAYPLWSPSKYSVRSYQKTSIQLNPSKE